MGFLKTYAKSYPFEVKKSDADPIDRSYFGRGSHGPPRYRGSENLYAANRRRRAASSSAVRSVPSAGQVASPQVRGEPPSTDPGSDAVVARRRTRIVSACSRVASGNMSITSSPPEKVTRS